MTNIQSIFSNTSHHWGLQLPTEAETGNRVGKIIQKGWAVWFKYVTTPDSTFLDYYACHRMAGEHHVRIHANGSIEELPSIDNMRAASDNPAEDAALAADFYARNQKVNQMLQEKGFCIDGDEPGGVQINRLLKLQEYPKDEPKNHVGSSC